MKLFKRKKQDLGSLNEIKILNDKIIELNEILAYKDSVIDLQKREIEKMKDDNQGLVELNNEQLDLNKKLFARTKTSLN